MNLQRINKVWPLVSDETKAKIRRMIAADISNVIGDELGFSLVEKVEAKEPLKLEPQPQPRHSEDRRIDPGLLKIHGRQFPSAIKLAKFYDIAPSKVYYWLRNGVDLETVIPNKKSDISAEKTLIKREGGYVMN